MSQSKFAISAFIFTALFYAYDVYMHNNATSIILYLGGLFSLFIFAVVALSYSYRFEFNYSFARRLGIVCFIFLAFGLVVSIGPVLLILLLARF